MKDVQGIDRGQCTVCQTCPEFNTPGDGSVRCSCGHTPGEHKRMDLVQDQGTATTAAVSTTVTSNTTVAPTLQRAPIGCRCPYPGCAKLVDFDLNTGEQGDSCLDHKGVMGIVSVAAVSPVSSSLPHRLSDASGTLQVPCATLPPARPSSAPSIPSMVGAKCAIPECRNSCFVDQSGKVHECCGYSHAMEHQRRQALQQQLGQSIIKGTTHCLLPECSKPCWPFMNYCGRSHAKIGDKRGLKAPPPPSNCSQSKDSTMCILPECKKPKFTDTDGTTHPYCSKSHADSGKDRGIVLLAESEENCCELEGCTQSKRREGTRVHSYCCLDHARQDESKIVTPLSKVNAFLSQFPNLKVVSLNENKEAKPGGTLYERFKAKKLSLPEDQRKTCLAFHGTSEQNISSICKNGYDSSKRGTANGQFYGNGEYFGTTPDESIKYCYGGKKLLLNELLLGTPNVDHTQSGTIIVMKDPAHDLPRFVITFAY